MTATAKTITLKKAVAGSKKGVFTADVTWELSATLTAALVDALPDRIAYLFAAQLPKEGSPYPGLPLCTCRGVSCTTGEEAGLYDFVANYSDENSAETGATNEDPLLDRPIIRPSAALQSKLMTRDRDNKAILNAAGDPIKQSIDDNTIGFQITSNVAAIPNYLGGLRNTCNDSQIVIAGLPIVAEAARFILPNNWLSERKNRNDVNYWEFTYEILIDETDLHYGYPLNAGFRQLKEDEFLNTYPVTITALDGSEPTDPVPLDEDGVVLEEPTPESVTYREVKKYPTAPYASLPGID